VFAESLRAFVGFLWLAKMADWLWSSLAAFAENMRVLAIFLVDGYIFVGIVIFLTGGMPFPICGKIVLVR